MFGAIPSALCALGFVIGLGLLVPGVAAQSPDTGADSTQAAPAGDTKVEPAVKAEEQLTPEEIAEREGRKACKVAICAALNGRGADISCKVLKSWRKEQLDKIVAKTRISWPWGRVICNGEVQLDREMLAKARSEDKFVASLPAQRVSCAVERDKEEPAEITLELAPKVTFERGKATKASLNWGKVEGPKVVKGAIWTATATDNTLNVMQSSLIEDINDFMGRKCDEVRSEWEGK